MNIDLNFDDEILSHANGKIPTDDVDLNGQPLFDLNTFPLDEESKVFYFYFLLLYIQMR